MVRTEILDPYRSAARAAPAPFACFGEGGMHQQPASAGPAPLAAGLFGMGPSWGPEQLLTLRRAAGCDAAYGLAA